MIAMSFTDGVASNPLQSFEFFLSLLRRSGVNRFPFGYSKAELLDRCCCWNCGNGSVVGLGGKLSLESEGT